MRTKLSLVILQMTAMVVSAAAIAVAQSDETSTQQEPVSTLQQDTKQPTDEKEAGEAKPKEDSPLSVNMSSSSLLKRLDDALSLIAKLKKEIEKIDVQQAESATASAIVAQLPDEPPKSPLESIEVVAPVPPAAPATPAAPAVTKAEVDSSEAFQSDAGNSFLGEVTVGDYIDTMPIPVLNGSTPDWVKNGLVLGEDHSFAISSTLMPDLDQCREDLKSRMMSEVRVYLDKHVLEFSNAYQLPELTQVYVEKYWVKKGQVFDNIQDRPSGTYHQLWIGLHISSEQLAKIREWEKQEVREQRTKKVGVLGGFGVCAITLLSGAVGLLARREKAKLKT